LKFKETASVGGCCVYEFDFDGGVLVKNYFSKTFLT
jgi:hypothetical protein